MPWLDAGRRPCSRRGTRGRRTATRSPALLFGDVNPSGKLPETFPKSEADLPTRPPQQYPGVKAAARDLLRRAQRRLPLVRRQGHRAAVPVRLRALVHDVRLRGLTVKAAANGTVTVGFTRQEHRAARRRRGRAGVRAATRRRAGEPPKQLRGYQKLLLQPGESRTVSLSLDPRAFAVWDTGKHAWVVPGGKYAVLVGSSSRDIRLQAAISVPKRVLGP